MVIIGKSIYMNEKELSEIRRRFRADKSNISHVRGCYVNEQKEIISEFDQSVNAMPQDESEELLSILKKTLVGTAGKNLIDIEFSTRQVMEGEEHKTLMALKNSALKDDAVIAEFYKRVIGTLDITGNYLILLAYDSYDVFSYTKDGEKEGSENVFTYILCSICPVKTTKPALGYYAYENIFRNIAANLIVGPPELGFMFPSFDDRAANIYNALFYSRSITESHKEFADSIFKCELPLPAAVQKETFNTIIGDTVAEECDYDVVQAIHGHICGLIEEQKANKESVPPKISKITIKNVLETCGINEKRVAEFEKKYDEGFGPETEIQPKNIVSSGQFEVKTADITIKVNPERSDLISTQVINGIKYILIRAEEDVEVNGVSINIS